MQWRLSSFPFSYLTRNVTLRIRLTTRTTCLIKLLISIAVSRLAPSVYAARYPGIYPYTLSSPLFTRSLSLFLPFCTLSPSLFLPFSPLSFVPPFSSTSPPLLFPSFSVPYQFLEIPKYKKNPLPIKGYQGTVKSQSGVRSELRHNVDWWMAQEATYYSHLLSTMGPSCSGIELLTCCNRTHQVTLFYVIGLTSLLDV